jgi:hypothetical protein
MRDQVVAASAATTQMLRPFLQTYARPWAVAGQSGTATFTVTPMNGFNSQVSFACSGLPSGATCTLNPSVPDAQRRQGSLKHSYRQHHCGNCSIAGTETIFALSELCVFYPLSCYVFKYGRSPETGASGIVRLWHVRHSHVGGGAHFMRQQQQPGKLWDNSFTRRYWSNQMG